MSLTDVKVSISSPDHFYIGGDWVKPSSTDEIDVINASTLAQALESDDEPEDVQARLFYRLAVSSGNDRRALSAFIRRDRPAIREEDLATVTCPVLVVLGDRDMTTSAARLVAALPSASLVTLPGVDHFATPSDFRAIDATMRFFGLG